MQGRFAELRKHGTFEDVNPIQARQGAHMLFTILDAFGLTLSDLLIAAVILGMTLGAAMATMALALTTATAPSMPSITAFRMSEVAR